VVLDDSDEDEKDDDIQLLYQSLVQRRQEGARIYIDTSRGNSGKEILDYAKMCADQKTQLRNANKPVEDTDIEVVSYKLEDMVKFGRSGRSKQACKERVCNNMMDTKDYKPPAVARNRQAVGRERRSEQRAARGSHREGHRGGLRDDPELDSGAAHKAARL